MSNNESFPHRHDGGTLVSANGISTRLSDAYFDQWVDDPKFRAATLANLMLSMGRAPHGKSKKIKRGAPYLYTEPIPIPGSVPILLSRLQLRMFDNEDESNSFHKGKRELEDFLVTAKEKFYKVNRLYHVLQLAAKSAHDSEKAIFSSLLNHNRGDHTFMVAAIGMYILQAHNLHHLLPLFICAALNHDIATPALGDPTMALDKQNLDEEDHWKEMMQPEGWQFLEEQKISSDDIDEIIHTDRPCNNPTLMMLKALLNICDRIASVCDDAEKIYGQMRGTRIGAPKPRISTIVQQMPLIGEIYRHVRIKDEQLYIDDVSMAKDFLWLRANMFRYCYYYPENNSRDVLITKALEPLYKSGNLTPTMLRNFTDDQLLDFVANTYGLQGNLMNAVREWEAEYEIYRDGDDVEKQKRKLTKQGYLVLGHVPPRKPFKPGTGLLVEVDDGTGPKIVTMAEHSPQLEAKIKAMANEIAGQGQIFYMRPNDHTKGADLIRELFLAVDAYQQKAGPAKPKQK